MNWPKAIAKIMENFFVCVIIVAIIWGLVKCNNN